MERVTGLDYKHRPCTHIHAADLGGDIKYACGITYSLHWWIVMLELFAIVFALLGSFVEALYNRHFVLHVFAIATTLYCVFASTYVTSSYV